jgi:rSAM-associated Gly-rich repeat protein
MKISSKAGLVGFLLALSSLNIPRADAKRENPTSESPHISVESRLSKISKNIKEQENQAMIANQSNEILLAAAFLNHSPSFRNNNHGWINGVKGWINHGSFANKSGGGGSFINRR